MPLLRPMPPLLPLLPLTLLPLRLMPLLPRLMSPLLRLTRLLPRRQAHCRLLAKSISSVQKLASRSPLPPVAMLPLLR